MEAFSSYVLSVTGIILLSVLVHMLMPEGSMSKYIQNIFALIVVFVIVSPIGNLVSSSFQISDIIQTSQVALDEEFIVVVNEQTIRQLNYVIQKDLEEFGFNNVFVAISANLLHSPLNIEKVEINLQNLVMNDNVKHINKYSKIKQIVLNHIDIEEGNIVFYG
jgi:stage III sporulation protein AF